MAKVALMILPVAVLLAHIASVKRNETDQRVRAEALLRKFDANRMGDHSHVVPAIIRCTESRHCDVAR